MSSLGACAAEKAGSAVVYSSSWMEPSSLAAVLCCVSGSARTVRVFESLGDISSGRDVLMGAAGLLRWKEPVEPEGVVCVCG